MTGGSQSNGRITPIFTTFQLIHVEEKCALQTKGRTLPKWCVWHCWPYFFPFCACVLNVLEGCFPTLQVGKVCLYEYFVFQTLFDMYAMAHWLANTVWRNLKRRYKLSPAPLQGYGGIASFKLCFSFSRALEQGEVTCNSDSRRLPYHSHWNVEQLADSRLPGMMLPKMLWPCLS